MLIAGREVQSLACIPGTLYLKYVSHIYSRYGNGAVHSSITRYGLNGVNRAGGCCKWRFGTFAATIIGRVASDFAVEGKAKPVRVFISEYLVGGACSGQSVAASMQTEGRLMLEAIAGDIASLPGFSVVTTLEAGLPIISDVEVIPVESAAHEKSIFHRLLGEVDAVLVIAPETDGILADRCQRVRDSGVASWNCSPAVIALCGDKLALAEHLQSHGIPTVPAKLADLSRVPDDNCWPIVLKPRDGAGSCLTFRIQNPDQWKSAAQEFRNDGLVEKCLCQPFVAGRSLSVGVNLSLDGMRIECLPVGEQHLSDDGRFRYLGGTIPADISTKNSSAIHDLVKSACRTIEGLAGYIGFDLLLPDEGAPLIVEINPRLTTSYIGYRQLFRGKIPQIWLSHADNLTGKSHKSGSIQFRLTPLSSKP
jgi:predicted ATP-grasp superfamily ATP-dependent carboligase